MDDILKKYNCLSNNEKIEFIKKIIPSLEELIKEDKEQLVVEFYPILNTILEKYGLNIQDIMFMLQMFSNKQQ
ncbi:hypothetical protein SAMN05661008_00911 [Alkalithermobacter thermoalcaliphilus JW-YL-7 = DSM 7308]|uniref:Uncharacterized protein n=1 Tax=Alkalithermobacter thermoalcaliphilus JW-YL-7 = DSM 7308 TaxID=1121328 RepID=A0A150FQH4_CLOPD|nr:hypothetical protein JWYL7_0942 [[Clostridium] paradoxum JW-YL-7 = DSM 7308]SHK79514.1 hypothetical protein SAMN05661008_00911 [[Clostridium] paradoxum JW-YL-7 = DSM 7308]